MQKRFLQRLESCFKDNCYYEAHQIYRTIYYRLARENKWGEIYDLLYQGAMRLFEVNERISGADLANLLVDTLVSKVKSLDELKHSEQEVIDNIKSLFQNILPNSPERIHFVAKILKINYIPTAIIRFNFAKALWDEKNYSDSRMHFIFSSDSGACSAEMLIEYQTKAAYIYEVDLMIAQFVLQVLCIGNKEMYAFVTFHSYVINHPDIQCRWPPFKTPLLNFIFFLLMAIRDFKGTSQVFNVLCQLYEKSLNRDPCYKDYLRQIGQIYFGMEKKAQHGELFSNLLQSLFDMSDQDDGASNNNRSHHITFSANTNQEVDLD